MAEDTLIEDPACDIRVKENVRLVAAEKILLVGLWITCFLLDSYVFYVLSATLYIQLPLYIIANGILVKMLSKEFSIVRLLLLFPTMQIPLLLLGSGAWHGLRAWREWNPHLKTRWALLAKLSLVREINYSFEKLSVGRYGNCTRGSCVQPQSVPAPVHAPSIPGENDDASITPNVQYGVETVKMTKTEFIKGTNRIQLNQGSPLEINGGESSVYKYTVRCFQALFQHIRKLSYHIVTDSTDTRIIHASCTDQVIGSLPLVPCNDTHYVLNLATSKGHEVYAATKRTNGGVTIFIRTDLTKLVWLPIWLLTIFKLYFWISSLTKGMATRVVMAWSTMLGLVTMLLTDRALYHSMTDTLLLAGFRIFFPVVRATLLCGLGVLLDTLGIIAVSFLTSKAAGMLSFTVYIAYMKAAKNVELFGEAVDRYTFYPAYDPLVQVGESLAYSCWSIYLYCSAHENDGLPFMLITITGQGIGLVWLRFARSRLGQPLRDPARMLDLIKEMEYRHT